MLKYILIPLLLLLASACSREIPSDPACRVQDEKQHLPPANAICLIKLNDKLVAIKQHNSADWQLPFAKALPQTSAQCTAHLGVWKSTGLNVSVGKLLFINEQQLHYFACSASSQFNDSQQDLPVPSWAAYKIEKIALLDPFASQYDHWQPGVNILELRHAFNELDSD